ncbi:hypothetical protein QO058_01590 [Bosea vestrisii]|uniref:hypothetical protein n=1 Tax=Bosea vestrisii TaxID=151416 RepID=UPI0024DFDFF9|nr:hypothetical protein [Bosea vestrisii]WID97005.1 hypothetical protein QO058_01590 [Bosea vestrisii]
MADRRYPWLDVEPTDDPRIVLLRFKPQMDFIPPPALTLNDAVSYALAAMHGGPSSDLDRALDMLHHEGGIGYRKVLEAAVECGHVHTDFRFAFHSNWSVHSFRHRANIPNDDLIIRALRRVFPPYSGETLILFRGERASELEAGRIGLNWSTNRAVAEMFASGLCRCDGGESVLLTATATPSAIITGPNDEIPKSVEEREHIVDPRMLVGITEIERLPADLRPRF